MMQTKIVYKWISNYRLSFGISRNGGKFIRCEIEEYKGFNMLASFGNIKSIEEIFNNCKTISDLNSDNSFLEINSLGHEFLRIYIDKVELGYYVDEYMAKGTDLMKYVDEGEVIESEIPIDDFIRMTECYINFLNGNLLKRFQDSL